MAKKQNKLIHTFLNSIRAAPATFVVVSMGAIAVILVKIGIPKNIAYPLAQIIFIIAIVLLIRKLVGRSRTSVIFLIGAFLIISSLALLQFSPKANRFLNDLVMNAYCWIYKCSDPFIYK